MYNNVKNSKTFHFQLKSLKNTQYLGLGEHFFDKGKTGLKSEKLSFRELNSGQITHNFKKMKVASIKNISIFNPMVLVPPYDNCTDCGVHLPKPFLNIYTLFFIRQLRISVINMEFVQDTLYAYGLHFTPSVHNS